MSTPPPRRKDPYDFPPLSPLNADDLQRNFDDYEDLSWEDSFERSVVSHKAPGRRNGGLKVIYSNRNTTNCTKFPVSH